MRRSTVVTHWGSAARVANATGPRSWPRTGSRVAATVALAGLALAGCASEKSASSGAKTPPAATAYNPLHALLPTDVADAGVIRVGSDISSPPFEFYDTKGHVTGIDYDVVTAIAGVLGVKASFINQNFDGLISSLQAHRFDMIASAMQDTPARQQQVHFVDEYLTTDSALFAKGNPKQFKTLDDLCGSRAAQQSGTIPVQVVNKQSAECLASGKPPIQLKQFQALTDCQLAIRSGRADVEVEDAATVSYLAKSSGGGAVFEGVRLPGRPVYPYGLAFLPGGPGLENALKAGMQKIIDNGEYVTILKKYGAEAGAVTQATVNGGR